MKTPATPLARTAARCLLIGFVSGLMLVGQAGCSLFVDPRQDVTIEASDPSARLFVDGREVGVGKAIVPLKRNDTYAVRATLPDGRFAGTRIRRNVSTTGVIDVVGGIFLLFPFLGVLGPGFWQLEPDYLFLRIPDAQPGTQPGQ